MREQIRYIPATHLICGSLTEPVDEGKTRAPGRAASIRLIPGTPATH